MGGFKHTGAVAANAAGQYLVYGQAAMGTITLDAGAVGTPSLTFNGDTNNGWWSPGADQQAWSIAGVEAMRLDASRRFGIGITPTTSAPFQLRATASAALAISILGRPADDVGVVHFLTTSGATEKARIQVSADNSITITQGAAATTRMVFDASGAVTFSNSVRFSGASVHNVAVANVVVGSDKIGFSDPTRAANNRYVEFNFNAGNHQWRFVNDAYSAAADIITATGGAASGVTQISHYLGSSVEAFRLASTVIHCRVLAPSSAITAFRVDGTGAANVAEFHSAVANDARVQITANGVRNWQLVAYTADRFAIRDHSAAVDRLSITNDGRVYGSALHNNAGAVTGTTNQYLASGTYTPTLANVANTSARSVNGTFKWFRLGNVVFVEGSISMTASGAGNTTVSATLPPPAGAIGSVSDGAFHTISETNGDTPQTFGPQVGNIIYIGVSASGAGARTVRVLGLYEVL